MIVATTTGQVVAHAEPSAAQLAARCAACHRFDNKPSGMPPLVSLSEELIVSMMRGFKARPRSSPIMHVVSSSLTDAETIAVANYLSHLPQKSGR